MRFIFVVASPPLADNLAHLGKVAEQIQVEHLVAHGAVSYEHNSD